MSVLIEGNSLSSSLSARKEREGERGAHDPIDDDATSPALAASVSAAFSIPLKLIRAFLLGLPTPKVLRLIPREFYDGEKARRRATVRKLSSTSRVQEYNKTTHLVHRYGSRYMLAAC